MTGKWALSDDSGLSVYSLSGRPGVYSSRYANTDEERINRLLLELESVEDRRAFFSAALCLAAPDNNVLIEVEGRCEGLITKEPRGRNGFGYDPIFEVNTTGLTFAEMDKYQKLKIGHRGSAFSLLEPQLRNILNP